MYRWEWFYCIALDTVAPDWTNQKLKSPNKQSNKQKTPVYKTNKQTGVQERVVYCISMDTVAPDHICEASKRPAEIRVCQRYFIFTSYSSDCSQIAFLQIFPILQLPKTYSFCSILPSAKFSNWKFYVWEGNLWLYCWFGSEQYRQEWKISPCFHRLTTNQI